MRTAEVAGKAGAELTDDEVLAVLTKEAKKRREAAEAFADAGRAESADKELAEEQVLAATCRRSCPTTRSPTWSRRRSPAGGFTGRRRWARR